MLVNQRKEVNMNNTLSTLIKNATANTSIATVETVGKIKSDVIHVAVEKKDENGNKVTVYNTLRNKLAVRTMVDMETLCNLETVSKKAFAIACGRLTTENAKEVGLKTPLDLLVHTFGKKYSRNTLSKYRRISKIFAKPCEADKITYEWRDGIDSLVSVSNLDVVLTLVKDCENVDTMSDTELSNAFETFYANYVATERIHLNYSQSELKKEVKAIINPDSIIDGEAKEVNTPEDTANDTETSETEVNHEEEAKIEVSEAISIISNYFKGDSEVEAFMLTLIEKLSK